MLILGIFLKSNIGWWWRAILVYGGGFVTVLCFCLYMVEGFYFVFFFIDGFFNILIYYFNVWN